MASPGLLFVLLISSQLLVITVSAPSADKILQNIKKVLNVFVENLDDIKEITNSFVSLINNSGPAIAAVINLLHFIITGQTKDDKVLKAVVSEFQSLNVKLDKYHVDQKWNIWATTYSKPEMKINIGWKDFLTLVKSLAETTDTKKMQRHIDEFITSYKKNERATKELNEYLTAKDTTFINNLALHLADYVKCHQKDIGQYTVFIYTLIFKGNMLNQVYYYLKKISSPARIDEAADIAYGAANAMFEVQKFCITQIMEYVEKDVMGLIDEKKDRKKLSDEIREFLERKDNKYEWMVVAFKTKKSEHSLFKIRNKHTLTGFSVMSKGEVSVGVARQKKGKHTKAGAIKQVIQQCLPKLPWCYNVEKKLSKCQKSVGDIPLSQLYTAVHAFHGNSHESHTKAKPDIKADPKTISVYDNVEFDVSTKVPASDANSYIYEGECKIFVIITKKLFRGKFHVTIKSDEEIENKPCSKLKCGSKKQGQCITVGSPTIAICECQKPYYGKNCEKNLNDYKKSLKSVA